MKKLVLYGTLCLAMGMASCKTYCPAYGSAQPDTNAAPETVIVSATAPASASDDING
ncbi:hypothetical protein [Pontibacter beigongshangensis]|uniref:hypothetical protein n=1 Tax=Pontibacter beigongshangensis TaxID=2574733 RepID=UPI00164FD803|nr:hypothetical protein [Pontibacter beigongshangensis]